MVFAEAGFTGLVTIGTITMWKRYCENCLTSRILGALYLKLEVIFLVFVNATQEILWIMVMEVVRQYESV